MIHQLEARGAIWVEVVGGRSFDFEGEGAVIILSSRETIRCSSFAYQPSILIYDHIFLIAQVINKILIGK